MLSPRLVLAVVVVTTLLANASTRKPAAKPVFNPPVIVYDEN